MKKESTVLSICTYYVQEETVVRVRLSCIYMYKKPRKKRNE